MLKIENIIDDKVKIIKYIDWQFYCTLKWLR